MPRAKSTPRRQERVRGGSTDATVSVARATAPSILCAFMVSSLCWWFSRCASGSSDLLHGRKTVAVQSERDVLVERAVQHEANDGSPHVGWCEKYAGEELFDRATLSTRVRFDERATDARRQSDARQGRGEPNAELRAGSLLARILGEETDLFDVRRLEGGRARVPDIGGKSNDCLTS